MKKTKVPNWLKNTTIHVDSGTLYYIHTFALGSGWTDPCADCILSGLDLLLLCIDIDI